MTRNKFVRFVRVWMFAVFSITCASALSFAATYHVATTGNDSNAGTLSSPFQTVQKGLHTVHPGDTCFIGGGTYNEALVLGQSGTGSAAPAWDTLATGDILDLSDSYLPPGATLNAANLSGAVPRTVTAAAQPFTDPAKITRAAYVNSGLTVKQSSGVDATDCPTVTLLTGQSCYQWQ